MTDPLSPNPGRDEFVCLPGVLTEFALRITQFIGEKPRRKPTFIRLGDTLEIERAIAAYIDERREHVVRIVHFFTGRDIYLRDGSRTEFYWELVSNGFLCMDCNIDTDAIAEYYMIQHHLWSQIHPDQIGHLCIGCAETRLGRTLTATDFLDAAVNTTARLVRSARLTERLRTAGPTIASDAVPLTTEVDDLVRQRLQSP